MQDITHFSHQPAQLGLPKIHRFILNGDSEAQPVEGISVIGVSRQFGWHFSLNSSLQHWDVLSVPLSAPQRYCSVLFADGLDTQKCIKAIPNVNVCTCSYLLLHF